MRNAFLIPRHPLTAALCAAALAWSLAPAAGAQGMGGPGPGAGDAGPLIEAPDGAAALRMDEAMSLAAPSHRTEYAPPPPPLGAEAPPVVVELFTAQGCSSCPPADALLAGLTDHDDILPLAWHVDYWDYLGWADAFARPEFTRRQHGYAIAARERGVYTPQIIVDGEDTPIHVDRGSLLAMVADHAARPPAVSVTARPQGEGYHVELMPRSAIPGGVDVVLVRYAPMRQVTILAGENRGEVVDYANVVLAAAVVTHWDARGPLRLTVRPAAQGDPLPPDTRDAILTQQVLPGGLPGPILTALRLN